MTGVIFLDKPKGLTSFVAANRVKRILNAKKSGHTGTLDPMATGVLVVMLGSATRFIDFLHTHDKAYEATVRLGVTTDTLDIEGEVLSQTETNFKTADFESAMLSFLGEIEQVPPMYSAIKKDGKKLYELAREGIEIERESRKVNIYSLELTGADESKQEFSLRVSCSSGTYERSLSSDIGEKLGCVAVLTSLRRVEAHGVDISRCKPLEEIGEGDVVALDSLLEYPSVTVTAAQAQRFSNGGALDRNRIHSPLEDGILKVYSPKGKFLGLGDADADQLKIKRIYSET